MVMQSSIVPQTNHFLVFSLFRPYVTLKKDSFSFRLLSNGRIKAEEKKPVSLRRLVFNSISTMIITIATQEATENTTLAKSGRETDDNREKRRAKK